MDEGTFEVFAGLTILYAVIRLLKTIFEFITKTITSKKSVDEPPTSTVSAQQCMCFTDTERERIMHVIQKLETVDWKSFEGSIEDLWKWHNVEDDDGVKRWYVQKSLKDNIALTRGELAQLAIAVEQLSSSTATNTQLFDRLLQVMARDVRDN